MKRSPIPTALIRQRMRPQFGWGHLTRGSEGTPARNRSPTVPSHQNARFPTKAQDQIKSGERLQLIYFWNITSMSKNHTILKLHLQKQKKN